MKRPSFDTAGLVVGMSAIAAAISTGMPAVAHAQTAASSGDLSFSVAEIGVITTLVGGVVLGLVSTFRLLQKAKDDAMVAKEASHAEALRLKDETIASVKERIIQKDRELETQGEFTRAQGDRMLGLLEGIVAGNREVMLQVRDELAQHTTVMSALTAAIQTHTDTTTAALTNIMQTLSRDPEAWKARQIRPEGAPA